ncbi:MAG TPA: hypothetical protein VGN36_08660 [Sphingorhabdus sp.]|nr:hypothetical protein [Sphingorhabdus sp.]
MATAAQSGSNTAKPGPKTSNGSSARPRKSNAKSQQATPKRKSDGRFRKQSDLPGWLTAAVSVVGVGVAVGAGLYATRRQWMSKAQEWRDEFSAAFADDETDYENFDQTRNAGTDAMRDHPGDDWEDIDDMSDASFPASDPPSFTPGRA